MDVIGRQPWISVYSSTGRGIDIILSLNIQQECIVVEKQFSLKDVHLKVTIFTEKICYFMEQV
jgi:hypothetical protein